MNKTFEQHWQQAKDQVANKRGYDCFRNAANETIFTGAAELMAQSIREEEMTFLGLLRTNIFEKDKEIERLKNVIESMTKIDPTNQEKKDHEAKGWEDFREGAYNEWKKRNLL